MALETLRKRGQKGGHHVFDADIKDYFGSIDHEKLMKLVSRRVSDRRVLKLVRQWLEAGVMEDGTKRSTLSGTPQGGVISPLLSNIYLHVLDTMWTCDGAQYGTLVRYADDFVVMTTTKRECEHAEKRVKTILTRLGLELHPEKTKKVELFDGKEGFDFLGCHLHKRLSGRIWEETRRRAYFLHRWPSQRAMRSIRERVRKKTPRGRCHADKRKGRHLQPGETKRWSREYFEALGLHRLRGTIRYPEAVNHRFSESPPVSRVRENRTHGLKGGLTQTSASKRKGK